VFLCLEGAMKKCSYRQKFSATLHQRGKSRTGDRHCILGTSMYKCGLAPVFERA
jgi:hypothetical protein